MHWTLKFLGDVELVETPAICDAVTRAVEPAGAVRRRGPRRRRLSRRPAPAHRLDRHGRGERADDRAARRDRVRAGQAGLPAGGATVSPALDDRPRAQQRRGASTSWPVCLPKHADFDGGVSTVDEVVVFSSELGRDGPTHEPLCHAGAEGSLAAPVSTVLEVFVAECPSPPWHPVAGGLACTRHGPAAQNLLAALRGPLLRCAAATGRRRRCTKGQNFFAEGSCENLPNADSMYMRSLVR